MKKYFGTDGIRGIANQDLTAELAFNVGRVLAYVLREKSTERQTVVIGKDTRISSDMLESALIAGLSRGGVDVYLLGVIPTPGVAYIVKNHHYAAGIMVSASHNPFPDNGIKIFGSDGYKLSDEMELNMEHMLDHLNELDFSDIVADKLGRVYSGESLDREYEQFLVTTGESVNGLHVALDCANGATSLIAQHVFESLGARVSIMANEPNGININYHVGSTHPEALAHFVKEVGAHIGFSFDGDGDRVITIDETGEVCDGDYILYILGKHLAKMGKLKENVVVATVMSNLGFYKALDEANLIAKTTAVGDRYVVEEMQNGGYSLGGEQSGHIILSEYATTGDGLMTAVILSHILSESNQPFSKMCEDMQKYPQILENIKVQSKKTVMESVVLAEMIAQKEAMLDGRGRILVRSSGTEELVRVMAEAETEALCEEVVLELSTLVRTLA